MAESDSAGGRSPWLHGPGGTVVGCEGAGLTQVNDSPGRWRQAAHERRRRSFMAPNIGNTDRLIRVLIGGALFSLYFFLPGNGRFVAFIGLIPLATAFLRWCPLYTLFGLRT